jgi:hypothetical protein
VVPVLDNETGRPDGGGRRFSTTTINAGPSLVPMETVQAYVEAGWAVFPLRGKVPAIPKRLGGNGVLDATADPEQIEEWWSGAYAGCNIGARVPEELVVIDIDPRNGGLDALAEWEQRHGTMPCTLTAYSGRGDGGRHLYFLRPHGGLTAKNLPTGVDLKTSTGYVVVPPSLHPDTRQPYRWEHAEVAEAPRWLRRLVRAPVAVPQRSRPRSGSPGGWSGETSVADEFTEKTTWTELLGNHGWTLVDGDGESDGSRWRHPTATSPWSATIRHGMLFCYSPNAGLEVTEPGSPVGYTRFRAYAMLNHHGDLSAAARALRAETAR